MVKLNEKMEAGTDAATITDVEVIRSSQTIANAVLPACGLSEFEALVIKHSLNKNLMYGSNALAGEVGEVCNVTKKLQMINQNPDWIKDNQESMGMPTHNEFGEQLKDELSDVLFYLTILALTSGLTIMDLVKLQSEKLSKQSIKYGRIFLK